MSTWWTHSICRPRYFYSFLLSICFKIFFLSIYWCMGFSSCSTQAQYLWCMGLVALQHVESSQTRDWTHVLCISRQILIHCTTIEVSDITWFSGLLSYSYFILQQEYHILPENLSAFTGSTDHLLLFPVALWKGLLWCGTLCYIVYLVCFSI